MKLHFFAHASERGMVELWNGGGSMRKLCKMYMIIECDTSLDNRPKFLPASQH